MCPPPPSFYSQLIHKLLPENSHLNKKWLNEEHARLCCAGGGSLFIQAAIQAAIQA